MESEYVIQTEVNNGKLMTKKELLLYLAEVLHILDEIRDSAARIEIRSLLIDAAIIEKNRKTFHVPCMEPPTGINSLLPWKRKEYQRWVSDAPKRKAEINRKEAAEDIRVNEVVEKLRILREEQNNDTELFQASEQNLKNILSMNVVPKDYVTYNSLVKIARYLVSDRAHSLTDAINLYHQELHWNKMECMAREQMEQTAAHQKRMEIEQRRNAQKMQQMHSEYVTEMREKINDAKQAAEDAKFYAELNFLRNL